MTPQLLYGPSTSKKNPDATCLLLHAPVSVPSIQTAPCFTGGCSPSDTAKGQVYALSDLLQFVECMYCILFSGQNKCTCTQIACTFMFIWLVTSFWQVPVCYILCKYLIIDNIKIVCPSLFFRSVKGAPLLSLIAISNNGKLRLHVAENTVLNRK